MGNLPRLQHTLESMNSEAEQCACHPMASRSLGEGELGVGGEGGKEKQTGKACSQDALGIPSSHGPCGSIHRKGGFWFGSSPPTAPSMPKSSFSGRTAKTSEVGHAVGGHRGRYWRREWGPVSTVCDLGGFNGGRAKRATSARRPDGASGMGAPKTLLKPMTRPSTKSRLSRLSLSNLLTFQ